MLISLLLALISVLGLSQPSTDTPASAKPVAAAARPTQKHMDWTIDGVKREAIVFTPPTATKSDAPVVFAFHGHGGNARNSAATFAYQRHWPEAITVYMQGLPTTGMTDPKGEKNGWQKSVGDYGDRDLKFFDAVLASLRKDYRVDDTRIYATGHSNGGAFTYLLWAARGGVFAAVAPSAGGIRDFASLKPKPAMHIAGRSNTTVPFETQQRIMARVRSINGCDSSGTEWAKDCTLYASKTGTPFVSLIYDGTHKFPDAAPPLIVKFFKEHTKAAASDAPKPDVEAKPATTPAAPATR